MSNVDFTPEQETKYEKQKKKQEGYIKFLHQEPLYSRLLEYAEKHGITGDTVCDTEEEAENFKLMDTYGRIVAAKIMREERQSFDNCSLTDTLDALFTTGGTWFNLEIKLRLYELTERSSGWAWIIDPEKYHEIRACGGYLLYIWPHDDDYLTFDWALWNLNEVPPQYVWKKCARSVAKEAGAKYKRFPGFLVKDAERRGRITGNIKG